MPESRMDADLAARILAHTRSVSDSRNDPDFTPEPAPAEPTEPVEPAEPVTEPVADTEPVAPEPTNDDAIPDPSPAPVANWDDTEAPTEPAPAQSSDFYRHVGSALGIEANSEAELLQKVKEFKTPRIQDQELQRLVELHERGIDWRTGISKVDYSKVDPVQLFEQDLRNDPRFKDHNGVFDEEKYLEELEATPMAVRATVGRQIAQALAYQQHQQTIAAERQAEERRMQFDSQLARATSRLSQLLPYEDHGIKFEERHASDLYRGLSDGSLMKDLFLDQNGQYDAEKIVITAAWRKWGPQIVKHMAAKAAVKTKRDILDRTQSPQIANPKQPAAPQPPSEPKELAPHEKIRQMQQSKVRQGSL